MVVGMKYCAVVILWISSVCHVLEITEACGGEYTGDNGSIYTPNFPNYYTNGLKCNWNIRVNESGRVLLTFISFKSEQGYDFLEVYDGSSRIARFSGDHSMYMLLSSGNSMRVRFHTDGSGVDSGFRATYSTSQASVKVQFGLYHIMDQSDYIEGERIDKSLPTPILRFRDAKTWDNRKLEIESVHRSDEGLYSYPCYYGDCVFKLNVMYPPELEDLSDITITEGEDVNITCPFIPGNPPTAEVMWTRANDDVIQKWQELVFTDVVVADTDYYTCIINYTLSWGHQGTLHKTFYFDVLYKPSHPVLSWGSSILKGQVRVIQNTSVNISCVSVGNPMPVITWVHQHRAMLNGNVNVQSNNKTITLLGDTNTTSKNDIDSVEDKNLTSGDRNVTSGSRNESSISEHYSVQIGMDSYVPISFNSQLTLVNLQAGDAGVYTCLVNYSIVPDIGQNESGIISSDLEVIVLYPASIPTFITGSKQVQNKIQIVENSTLNLTCESSSNTNFTLLWIYPSGQTVLGEELVIEKVKRNWDEGVYHCGANYTMNPTVGEEQSGVTKSDILVTVLYPPAKPVIEMGPLHLKDELKIMQNSSANITCTSYANPDPIITWTRPDGTILVAQQLELQDIQLEDEGVYVCQAENTLIPTVGYSSLHITTSELNVTVLYPPSHVTFTYNGLNETHNILNNEIDIVAGSNLTLGCEALSEPRAEHSWAGYYGSDKALVLTNITSNTTVTCIARNHMSTTTGLSKSGFTMATVAVIVKHAAKISTFHVLGKESSHVVDENTTATLICSVKSKALANVTIYRADTTSVAVRDFDVSSVTLKLADIACTDAGVYTCSAVNKYNTVPSVSVLHVFVLCSPRPLPGVGLFQNVSARLGTSTKLQFTAMAYPEPHNDGFVWQKWTDYQWIKLNSDKHFEIISAGLHTSLIIYDVKGKDYGRYRLSADNGIGEPFRQIYYISPQERTVISAFEVLDKGSNGIVDENSSVTLQCTVDSKAKHNVTLLDEDDTIVPSINNGSRAVYNIPSVTCQEAGLYTCKAFNEYVTVPDVQSLHMFVRCSPRPTPTEKLQLNVTSALGDTATMQFTALAYPEPNRDGFLWSKWSNSTWITIDTSQHVEIMSVGLHTALIIHKISGDNYGKYRLSVSNGVGDAYQQLYYLVPEGTSKPEQPKDFRCDVNLNDSTTVTLHWKPGFDGGLRQTFIIQYKMTDAIYWMNVSIEDTNEAVMNYTLSGLVSGNIYESRLLSNNTIGTSPAILIMFHTLEKSSSGEMKASYSSIKDAVLIGLGTLCVILCVAGVLYLGWKCVILKRKVKPYHDMRIGSGDGDSTSNIHESDAGNTDATDVSVTEC